MLLLVARIERRSGVVAYAAGSAGQSQQKGGGSPSRGGSGSILETSRGADHFGAGRHREHQAEYHEQGVFSRPPYEVKSARVSKMPWYVYALQFVSGLLLANGIPHFVQGVSRHR